MTVKTFTHSLADYLSFLLTLSVYVTICLCLFLSIFVYLPLSNCRSLRPSLSQSLYLSLYVSLFLSLHTIPFFLCLSSCLFSFHVLFLQFWFSVITLSSSSSLSLSHLIYLSLSYNSVLVSFYTKPDQS